MTLSWQASAASSALSGDTSGEVDAKLAAQRAYEADAYLTNADAILARLFLSSYDLAQFGAIQARTNMAVSMQNSAKETAGKLQV